MNDSLEYPEAQDSEVEIEVIQPQVEVNDDSKHSVEEFKISGDVLASKVKELIHQGNIRRIIIKNEEGKVLLEIPLTIGVVGAAISTTLFPVVAAVGALGAVVAHLSIVIEKTE
ncbi:MAG TPA: DUF4342 domain-containing protein [Stenomitos sp.]